MNATTEITTTAEAAAVAEPGAPVAPKKDSRKKTTTSKKNAPKARKGAKGAKKTATPSVPREFSKKAAVLDLLRRKTGATMTEIPASDHRPRSPLDIEFRTHRYAADCTMNIAWKRRLRSARRNFCGPHEGARVQIQLQLRSGATLARR